MTDNINIAFDAPPTVASFMKSDALFRLIAGPVGSGKTTGCIFEVLRRCIAQEPAPDGLRYTRWAIVRQTLKQLQDTVLKDIQQWLTGLVHFKVSDRTVYVSFGDVRSEWMLIPLEDPEDQRRLLSMQLTGAWMSEAIEMDPGVVAPLLGRCGRYPTAAKGKVTWYGVIADTNFPTEGDQWHKLMEVSTPPEWHVFKQPGGREPHAENLDNLPGGRAYYDRLAAGDQNPEWVRRYVDAQYGNDPSGSAVFRETFRRGFHTTKLTLEDKAAGREFALEPVYGYPIIVLQDFGRNPCSLIAQVDHKGRGLVLEEVVSIDMGLELHIRQKLMPALNKQRYMGRSVYVIGDPAGRQKSTSYEETSFDLLKRAGLNCFPAPTNDIDKRIRAVDAMLMQQRDGGAALLIDEDQCPSLTLAMQGRYRYKKSRTGHLSPLPEKSHPWSDLADDLQYFCLVIQGGLHGYIANRIQGSTRVVQSRQRVTSAAWT